MKILLAILLCTLPFVSDAKTFKGINENGEVVFTIDAKYVYAFSDGLARIEQQRLVNNAWVSGYGYINTRGEFVIAPNFEKAKDFVDGRAWVMQKGDSHWTLIDKTGNVIPTKKYEKVGYIMEGYSDRIAVYENGAMGWIDRNGKEVIPCKYVGSSTFDKQYGFACVTPFDSKTGAYGFIDKMGETVIDFQFIQAGSSSFHNGFCRVSKGGKTVLIDSSGTVQFTPKYNSLQNYAHGVMPVATKANRKGWGYLNLKNELVVPGIYDAASTFNSEGFAVVEKNGKKGLLRKDLELVLPLEFATIYCDAEDDGYICAVLPVDTPMSLHKTPKKYFDAELNSIDVGKNTLMPANGSSRIPFLNAVGKRGYMDRNFNIVIPAKYSKATDFNDGIALVLE